MDVLDLVEEFSRSRASVLWIGEMHGIKNNYRVYRDIIDSLPVSSCLVALEYPQNLENFSKQKFIKYKSWDDGRFSVESLDFFTWLNSKKSKIVCFDTRGDEASAQEGERLMASDLLSKIRRSEVKKTLVISGDFHSKMEPFGGVTPSAGLISKEGIKILSARLKYTGGHFYNHGKKELTKDFVCFDGEKLPYGTVTENRNPLLDNKYWIHAGEAEAIAQGATIRKLWSSQ